MNATDSRFATTWCTSLKVVSAGASALLITISYIMWRDMSSSAVPGTAVLSLLPVAILLGSLPFVVRGYRVENRMLLIRRLWWDTRIPLDGLKSAEVLDCSGLKGTWRVCGNGGLFSFTGWYQNKALGRFRLYANSFKQLVVLRLAHRTVVLSPDDPEGFVQAALAAR